MNQKECPFQSSTWLYENCILVDLNAPNESIDPVELYDVTIRNADLGGSVLRRWVFEECELIDCDLSQSFFEGCIFQGCTFIGCRMIGGKFEKMSTLQGPLNFKDSVLSFSSFAKAQLSGAHFERCDLTEVDWTGANLESVHFIECSLKGGLFSEVNLNKACIASADITMTELQNAQLHSTIISPNQAIEFARLNGFIIDES